MRPRLGPIDLALLVLSVTLAAACSGDAHPPGTTPRPVPTIAQTSSPTRAEPKPTAAATVTMSSPGVALPATGTIVAPSAIAVDAAGDLFIGDYPTCQIFRLVDGTLITVAGTGVCGYGGDGGPATRAQLQFIHGIAVDSAGSLYIAELDCRVRRVSDGIITTVAGDGTCGYAGDGGPAKDAELDGPVAVATDAAGDLYISDDNNCRVRLVRGATITTVAGDGTCHFRGDGGPATEAGIEPAGVAVASDGTLYIVDTPNGREQHAPYGACRVRAVRRGTITTAAGTSCMSFGGDGGPAVEASMELPVAIAIGVPDDVVIGDTGNCRVREVHNGIILTVAGRGPDADRGCRYSGDGGPATGAGLSPTALAVDGVGNLYIGDAANCQVRRVASGLITTVAGTGHCPS